MDEIIIFRLVTGEDIICRHHKISKDEVLVCDPMMLIVKFKGNNSTVIMEHWLPFEIVKSNEAVLDMKSIITSYYPNESLCEYYSNLVDKFKRILENYKSVEDMDISDMSEVMEALKDMKGQIIH